MEVPFPKCAPLALFLVTFGITGCNSNPATPTAPDVVVPMQSAITVEPATVQPEFIHSPSCRVRPPFGVRLSVIVGGARDTILRGLRFELTDSAGALSFPQVVPTPTPSEAPSIPTSAPIPFPGAATLPASPIPIPGAPPIDGLLLVSRGIPHRFPFFLKFGCGVFPAGTLLITADAADRSGTADTRHLRIRVGR